MPYPDPNHLRTPLARAKGLGSAKKGTQHWWMIKVSSILLIPLTLWFFFSLMHALAGGFDHAAALAWVKKPYNSLLLSVFMGMNFYHAGIAGQEIIIDYVPNHKIQVPAALAYSIFCYGLGIFSVFTVLYITFRL
ncbi:MAG: sdhD [Alphaproteobacteria bacterium]|nr:sdhD [Alphaproteobacteria bacterium]